MRLLLYSVIQAFTVLIFARVVASFLVRDWTSGLPRLIWDLTEPILGPLRRVLPKFGMLDFSPMAALFILYLLSRAVGLR